MTWLFVSTSPSEVRIMPVPAASPRLLPVSIVVKMSTTAGFTFCVIAAGAVLLPDALLLPLLLPLPNGNPKPLPLGPRPFPLLPVPGDVGVVAVLLSPECTASLSAAPMPPDAIASPMIATPTSSLRAHELGRRGPGGGPHAGAP